MSNSIAVDLKAARHKSGLTGEDCAHLLGVSEATISRFETGEVIPKVKHLATLSLIYGREMQSLARGLFDDIRNALPERLETLPAGSDGWSLWDTRNNTLHKIDARLQTLNKLDHGAA